MPKITEDDLDELWPHYKSYLVDILNGDYALSCAISDIRGLIGSRYDSRKTDSQPNDRANLTKGAADEA
jgi:hypothetical protein